MYFCRYCGYTHLNDYRLFYRRNGYFHTAICCGICDHTLSSADRLPEPWPRGKYRTEQVPAPGRRRQWRQILRPCLTEIQKKLNSRVVAWSLVDLQGQLHWEDLVGSSDEDYRQIILQPGRGLAGKATMFQRELRIGDIDYLPVAEREEYPIMQVEQLRSALAVPMVHEDEVMGAFMIGDSTRRRYTNGERDAFLLVTQQAMQRVRVDTNLSMRRYRTSSI